LLVVPISATEVVSVPLLVVAEREAWLVDVVPGFGGRYARAEPGCPKAERSDDHRVDHCPCEFHLNS
jgi:hypothetical protein